MLEDVRAACEANRCGAYNTTWACPPAFGDLEQSRAMLKKYHRGILVQSVQELEDDFDWEGIEALGKRHGENFQKLRARLREDYPDMLALGAGGCKNCTKCTYPDAPCRFPDACFSSMEAYGILVLDACKANGLQYYYGPNAIAYTSCFLLA